MSTGRKNDDDRETVRAATLAAIARSDPRQGARLERLVARAERLGEGNAYGEKVTGRQLDLVLDPLFEAARERARLLELCAAGPQTVSRAAAASGMKKDRVFAHFTELVRRNCVGVEVSNDEPVYSLKDDGTGTGGGP